MGQPVVHFEIIGKDGDELQSYFSHVGVLDVEAALVKAESLGGSRGMGRDEVMEGSRSAGPPIPRGT